MITRFIIVILLLASMGCSGMRTQSKYISAAEAASFTTEQKIKQEGK